MLLAQQVTYRVEPAVRVTRLVDGQDGASLVGISATVRELEEKGVEHCQGSLILGNAAYECEEGFMGTVESPRVAAAPLPVRDVPGPEPTPPPPDVPSGRAPAVQPGDDSADLLAEFMLKHL